MMKPDPGEDKMRVLKCLAIVLPAVLGACVVQDRGPPIGAEIAFGYSDGYWDRGHHWHAWRDNQEAEAWQRQNSAHYYGRRHDQEAGAGWHDNDQWWQRH